MKPLKILFVSSEVRPFAMSGGLGDVSGALPKYIKKRGHDIRVVMPSYGSIDRSSHGFTGSPLGVPVGGNEVWCGVSHSYLPQSDVPVFFIENNNLFDRGGLYGDENGEYGDNSLRFSLLSRGALQLCHYLGWYPDVIHCNDWQTALIPGFLNSIEGDSQLGKAATLLTIHNLGYQGRFPSEKFNDTGLPWNQYTHMGYEYKNGLNILKGGIYHSTLINSVSRSYAHEIQTPQMGEGLDGVLREKGAFLYGVVNGIDQEEWNPSTDPHLPAHFSANSLEGKKKNKKELQMELGLEVRDDLPLVAMVTRLAHQKGIDLVAEAIHRMMDLGIQFVLVGTGEKWAEKYFGDLNHQYPGRMKNILAFDTHLAHKVEAAADLFLMPSRYEPCGLNQIYSLRYGTLPVVRATGGLNDTVSNYDQETGGGTGFKFWDFNSDSLVGVVSWAVDTYKNRPNHFITMQKRAMGIDFSWTNSAQEYEELYYRAVYLRKQ
jgi:starch synthase